MATLTTWSGGFNKYRSIFGKTKRTTAARIRQLGLSVASIYTKSSWLLGYKIDVVDGLRELPDDMIENGVDNHPAFYNADSKQITLHFGVDPLRKSIVEDGTITKKTLAYITGMWIHELGHASISPSLTHGWLPQFFSHAADFKQRNNRKHAAFILEEGRVEKFMLGKYGKAALNYLHVSTIMLLTSDGSDPQGVWFLLAGREYITDPKIRTYYRDQFPYGDIIADEVERIARSYNALTDQGQELVEMKRLINELATLFDQLEADPDVPNPGDILGDPDEAHHGGNSHQAEADAKAFKEAQERADGNIESAANAPMGKGGASDALDTPLTLAEFENHAHGLLEYMIDELGDELSARADAVLNNPEIYRNKDIANIKQGIRQRDVNTQMRRSAERIQKEIDRIQEQARPGWDVRKRTGRLNANALRKFINNGDVHIFDKWNPGVRNVTSMEVVITLDLSGSMHSIIDKASQVMWVLAKGLQAGPETTVTVFGFSDFSQFYVLKGSADEVEASKYDAYPTIGGTTISPSIAAAKAIFTATKKQDKLFFVITDGGFGDYHHAVKGFPQVEKLGGETHLISIRYPGITNWRGEPGIASATAVEEPQELIPVIQQVVTGIMKGKLG